MKTVELNKKIEAIKDRKKIQVEVAKADGYIDVYVNVWDAYDEYHDIVIASFEGTTEENEAAADKIAKAVHAKLLKKFTKVLKTIAHS